jgi:hypothetical protein
MTDSASAERVLAARAIISAFYELPNNGTGGCLHVVTDDGNSDELNIKRAIETAELEQDSVARSVGEMLLALSPADRRLAVAFYNDPELVALVGRPTLHSQADTEREVAGILGMGAHGGDTKSLTAEDIQRAGKAVASRYGQSA